VFFVFYFNSCIFIRRYIQDDDGYYKLQTSKYECLEIQEQRKIKLIDPKRISVIKKSEVGSNVSSLTFIIIRMLQIYLYDNVFNFRINNH